MPWPLESADTYHRTVLGGHPSLLYPTTKGAIIQMTRAMAAHHGQEGIRVNCVAPGMVYTPMVRGRGMTDEMRKARIGQNLMKKEGTGWDVGHGVALEFSSPHSRTNLSPSCAVSLLQGSRLDNRTHHAGRCGSKSSAARS